MAADVRRYLAREPIAARPDTLGYRGGASCSATGSGVALGALAALRGGSGTAVIVWQAGRGAPPARRRARRSSPAPTPSNEFQAFLLSAGAPAGKKFVPADLLEQGEVVVERQFGSDDPLRAELLAGIGMQYLSAQRFEKAQPVLERAGRARAAGRTIRPCAHACAVRSPSCASSGESGEGRDDDRGRARRSAGGLSAPRCCAPSA